MHKHWLDMDVNEQRQLLVDLRHVVEGIPVTKLNMATYQSGSDCLFDEGKVKSFTPDEYHEHCGTAFCVLGWVAPIERFAKAFNVEPEVMVTQNWSGVDETWVSLDDRVDLSKPVWYAINELDDLFRSETIAPAYTSYHKDEVLSRIDNAVFDLDRTQEDRPL